MSGEEDDDLELDFLTDNLVLNPREITDLEEIGRGTYGVVYKGKCRGNNVAVKKLQRGKMNESQQEEFKRECQMLLGLRNINIVLLMGVSYSKGQMMIITELLIQNMEQYLESKMVGNVPIPLLHRINIADGIAQGLAWLHKANPPIVHHDLKPSNILLDKDDNPKICDFGLSLFKRDSTIRSTAGSKLWSAPEVLQDEEHNEKVDIYSFAIILWQLLVLEALPFRSYVSKGDLKEFISEVSNGTARPSLEQVPAKAHKLLNMMWHQNPEERPDMKIVVRKISSLKVKCVITDEKGQEFWNKTSPDMRPKTFEEFIMELNKYCGHDNIIFGDYEVLRIIFAKDDLVTLENFSKALNWFGPMKSEDDDLITRILYFCNQDWFLGDITRVEAEKTLKTVSEHAKSSDNLFPYIVRLSLPEEKDTSIHPATISYYSLNYVKDDLGKKKKNY